MEDGDQLPQALRSVDVGEVVNREPRCPCVLVLDTSGSMTEQGKITKLEEGLGVLSSELKGDTQARQRVEIAVITFGGTVEEAQPFVTAAEFIPPPLTARGGTPMGEAVKRALAMAASRKDHYKQVGLDYYQPWVFLITDGEPTDEWESAAKLVQEAEEARKVNFFSVGVGEARMDILEKMSHRPPKKLSGIRFVELFQWISQSTARVSHQEPGAGKVPVPATRDWEEAFV